MKKFFLSLIPLAILSISCVEKDMVGVTINATFPENVLHQGDDMSVYCGQSVTRISEKNVSGATTACYEGRVSSAGQGRLVAVYPAVETGGACSFSIGRQTVGEGCQYVTATVASPVFSAPMNMEFQPMTGMGTVSVVNKSGAQLKLSSIVADGGRLFYSKCDFASSSFKNTYSESEITVETGEMSLGVGQTVEVPFSLFPGEVAQSKVALTLNLSDASGKVCQVKKRVDFMRPKAGESSVMSIEILAEMIDDSPRDYTIVYPKSLTGAPLDGIKEIVSIIKTKTGINVPCVSDDSAEKEFEILFGDTNRATGNSVSCPDNAYVIKSVGGKLVIKGSSEDQLIAALYGLERDVLSLASNVSEGRLSFPGDLDIKKENGEILAMRHMVRELYDFKVKETLLKSFIGDSPVTVAQGACTDGVHGYYAFRNSAETSCIIYKCRLSDHSQVAKLQLDLTECGGACHVNDLVYEPDTDLIYVSTWSNAAGSPKLLLCVKASTMTQVQSVSSPVHSPTALAYNPSKKIFMSRAGTRVYVSGPGFTSSNLVNSSYDNYKYTNQGAGGDELYCYFPVNNGTNSQLLTFDWSGRQLWNIQIDNKTESESLFVVGEKYYWWCYGSSSGRLFLLTPVMKYTPGFKGGWSDIASPALN